MPVLVEVSEKRAAKHKLWAVAIAIVLAGLLVGIGLLPVIHPGVFPVGNTGIFFGAEWVRPGGFDDDGPGQFSQGLLHDKVAGIERWVLRIGNAVYSLVIGPPGTP